MSGVIARLTMIVTGLAVCFAQSGKHCLETFLLQLASDMLITKFSSILDLAAVIQS